MDPYEILKVSKDSNDTEIKKAYRKLAAQYHPDKGGDGEYFKKINEAYSKIATSEKRAEHENSQIFNSGFGDIFNNFGAGFGDIFEEFFNRNPRSKRPDYIETQTDDEIMFDIKISLAQLKKGVSKKIKYARNVQCSNCSGYGGKNKQTCAACNGKGKIVRQMGAMIHQSTCGMCFGTGYTFEEGCHFCRGEGFIRTKESVNIEIKQN